MGAYVDFGYGDGNAEISRDGEFLATLGFTWEQLANSHDPMLHEKFIAEKLSDNPKYVMGHSGNSWSNVCNVACVLAKHNWKTIDDIPEENPLRGRVVAG